MSTAHLARLTSAVYFCATLLLPPLQDSLGAPPGPAAGQRALRSPAEEVPIPILDGDDSVLHGGSYHQAVLARSSADTLYLFGGPGTNQGKFETPSGAPDRQGWAGVDVTDVAVHWQVSEFNAANLSDRGTGNRALWCGRTAEQASGWIHAPGYGNNWNDSAIYISEPVLDPGAGQTVDLDFTFNYDTEPGYDFFVVEYQRNSSWISVLEVSGSNKDGAGVFAAPGARFSELATAPITYGPYEYDNPPAIRIRLRFQSDGAWSDQDGLWPTHGGAVQVDDIVLTSNQGTHLEDHEGTAPYLFVPQKAPFFGDFSDVYARVREGDLDPCFENTTPLIGFIDYGQPPPNGPGVGGMVSTGGSLSANWDYGIPGGWVLNYTGGLTPGIVDLHNFVESPEFDWDLDGPGNAGPEWAGAFLRFSVWDHLPLHNAMFYRWQVRSRAPGEYWTKWRDFGFVYYGGGIPAWRQQTFEVESLLVTSPEKVQVRLGVVDLSAAFSSFGFDATASPLFDNVTFGRVRTHGPSILARVVDLAQEGFPAAGSIAAATMAERDALDIPFDMARDVNSHSSIITAGDSVVFDIAVKIPGTAIADIRMKWALRKNAYFEDALRQAPSRGKDEFVAASGPVWTGEVVAEPARTSSGEIVAGRYFVDLPDVNFLYPGDQLHYSIEATDDGARVSTLPRDLSGFGNWNPQGASTYSRTFTVRGLPSITGNGQPAKLVLNGNFGGRDDDAISNTFGQLGFVEGVDYDTYTVRGSTARISSGIGSAGAHGATAEQLAGYDTILTFWGSQSSHLLSNGSNSGNHDKSDDLATLSAWKELPGPRYSVYFGDHAASGHGAQGAAYVQGVMGVQLGGSDVRNEIGGQLAPSITGLLPGFNTPFAVYGGCPGIRRFDSITPIDGAVAGHAWLATNGSTYAGPAASVVYDRTAAEGRRVDITLPFGLGAVSSDVSAPPELPSTRAGLLAEIFTYLGVDGSGAYVTSAPGVREAKLAIVPNPFNPRTEIRLSMPHRDRVTVRVHDLRGSLVQLLLQSELDAGTHGIVWNGRDEAGQIVASGVYLVHARGSHWSVTKKLALVR